LWVEPPRSRVPGRGREGLESGRVSDAGDTRRSNKPCATTISTHSVSPDSMSLPKLNPVEPPWYGPVCPVVGEGWHREVSPYPDHRREAVIEQNTDADRRSTQLDPLDFAFGESRLRVTSGCAGPPAAWQVNLNKRTPELERAHLAIRHPPAGRQRVRPAQLTLSDPLHGETHRRSSGLG
jgi:hypothetical protein